MGAGLQRLVLVGGAFPFVVLALWELGHGRGDAAIAFSIVAALGPIAVALLALLRGIEARLPRRRFADRICLQGAEGHAAQTPALQALHALTGDELAVSSEQLVAPALTPRSWKSFGEQVTMSVSSDDEGSTVEVTSECISPQLVDYGKNRANVEAVIELLPRDDRR
jgi:hypothetical protein